MSETLQQKFIDVIINDTFQSAKYFMCCVDMDNDIFNYVFGSTRIIIFVVTRYFTLPQHINSQLNFCGIDMLCDTCQYCLFGIRSRRWKPPT